MVVYGNKRYRGVYYCGQRDSFLIKEMGLVQIVIYLFLIENVYCIYCGRKIDVFFFYF